MPQSSSKRLVAILLVLAVVIAIPAVLLTKRRGPKQSSDKVTRLAVMAMTSDLRGLISAAQTLERGSTREAVPRA